MAWTVLVRRTRIDEALFRIEGGMPDDQEAVALKAVEVASHDETILHWNPMGTEFVLRQSREIK